MSGRSVNLTTLFLGRLRSPNRLTSTSRTHFRQKLTAVLLESAEGETKICGLTGYRTRDFLALESNALPARLLTLSYKLFCNPWLRGVESWYCADTKWKILITFARLGTELIAPELPFQCSDNHWALVYLSQKNKLRRKISSLNCLPCKL